jgi:hypothetical protein
MLAFSATDGRGMELANGDCVTLRITLGREDATLRVRLAGRLSAEEAGELERVIDEAPGKARLELEELRSTDGAGLALLRRLRAVGIEMRGVPPHLAWRIEAEDTP